MQNKPLVVINRIDEAPHVASMVPSGITLLSVVFAGVAVLLSLYTLYRNKRVERNSRFESAYGAPLRISLREFEKSVTKLKAFIFPANREIDQLKVEIESTRIELEEFSFEVSNLLAEIDPSNLTKSNTWKKDFHSKIEFAESEIQSLAHPSVNNQILFRSKVEKVQGIYLEAVATARAKLDDVRSVI